MKKISKVLGITLAIFPVVTFAALSGVGELVTSVGSIVSNLTVVVMGIALLVFFWGLVKLIMAQGSETSKTDAKKIMGWGLVALFVMVSVWGLVHFLQRELIPGGDYSAPNANNLLPGQGNGLPGYISTPR